MASRSSSDVLRRSKVELEPILRIKRVRKNSRGGCRRRLTFQNLDAGEEVCPLFTSSSCCADSKQGSG
jgi:hypothetical protein